jgi:hypothetical protein
MKEEFVTINFFLAVEIIRSGHWPRETPNSEISKAPSLLSVNHNFCIYLYRVTNKLIITYVNNSNDIFCMILFPKVISQCMSNNHFFHHLHMPIHRVHTPSHLFCCSFYPEKNHLSRLDSLSSSDDDDEPELILSTLQQAHTGLPSSA